MSDKKPYSAPQIFQVELNHEQAILSQCSVSATNNDDTSSNVCAGVCRKCMSSTLATHGFRAS
jgi:hypothetical protein